MRAIRNAPQRVRMANRQALIALYRDLAEKLRAAPRQPLSTRDQERAAARPYGEPAGFNRSLS
jgi:hypothetical protein